MMSMPRALVLGLGFALAATACGSTSGTSGPPTAAPTVRPYPLDTCLVTGSKLGSMGDPIVKVYGDREIKFCCRPCVATFEANREKYLGMLPR